MLLDKNKITSPIVGNCWIFCYRECFNKNKTEFPPSKKVTSIVMYAFDTCFFM